MFDIPSGTKFRGKAIGDSIAALASAFPDLHRELLSIYVTEGVVVVELRIRGTHKGELALGSTSSNLYVCDYGNNLIREITPDGTVSSFASVYIAHFKSVVVV
jgi:hypothetical protein